MGQGKKVRLKEETASHVDGGTGGLIYIVRSHYRPSLVRVPYHPTTRLRAHAGPSHCVAKSRLMKGGVIGRCGSAPG